MIETPKIDLFLGTITEVVSDGKLGDGHQTYEVKVSIPGVADDLTAVPLSRGELDEPMPGNVVIIMSVDPVYHSVNFYTKLKESDFIGIRSNGKLIDITPDAITVGVFNKNMTYPEQYKPTPDKYIKITDTGDIIVKGSAINITADSETNITTRSANIKVTGECKLEASSAEIKSGNTKLTGGVLKVEGTAMPDKNGPFCTIDVCPVTGLPHRGSMVLTK